MEKNEDKNVFIVNWTRLNSLIYINSLKNIYAAVDLLLDFISVLKKKFPTVKNENLRFVGFSLGAHLASFLGNYFENCR